MERFAHLARERLPHVDPNQPERTLQNLQLLSDGRLTNGAALLFASRPQRLFPLARLRIGVFRSPTQIVDSHEFEGTLWEQVDGAIGNKDLQELTGASKPTVTSDFDELVKRGVLVREGST